MGIRRAASESDPARGLAVGFNKDQPRIPKGYVGAGRFMKAGQALIAVAKDAAHPGDGGRRDRGTPRLAKAGSKLTRRDNAVEQTFAKAAEGTLPVVRRERAVGTTNPVIRSPVSSGGPLKPGEIGGAKHPATPEGVRAAYDELKAEPDGWVSLDRLRARLGGTRAEQDRLLSALDDQRRIRLAPYPHRAQLPQSAHDAAIRVGGEDQHMIAIESGPIGANTPHPATPEAVHTSGATTPDAVEAAVRELGGSSHDFASLTDLRKRLGGTRQEQDRLLVQMARDRRIYLQPEENQKTLTEADRAAAVDLVGEPKHLVRLGKNAQAPQQPGGGEPRTYQTDTGGRITREEAAVRMFGTEGARSRLASAGGKIAMPPPAEIGAQLRAATSRQQARDIIAGMSVAQLRAFAATHGVPVRSGDNKTQLRDAIVQVLAGARIDAGAIFRNSAR